MKPLSIRSARCYLLRSAAASAGLVCWFAVAAAQGTPTGQVSQVSKEWLDSPYQLTIQLHVQEHPLMTPVFIKGLERELNDTLQSDLAKIAKVTVTTQKSQTMDDIIAKGWGALDRGHNVEDKKTHYVRVLYLEGGQYEIQARQADGYTGLVSPLRKARTADRLWVARQASLMITQDFGMVGEVESFTGKVVRVKLKGAKLAQPDSIKVQAGEVLAITRLLLGRDGKPQSWRSDHALLYVTGVQDVDATTRLYNRFDNVQLERRPRNLFAFRVIKLGTRWAPLQLRIVDEKTREPIPGISVAISPGGFESGQLVPVGATDAQGRVRSREMFRNVVFVKLTQGGRDRAGVPLPLLDDQFVDLGLSGTQEAERLSEFGTYFRQWSRRLGDAFIILDAEETVIRDLLVKGKEKEALAKGEELSERLKEDLVALRDGLDNIKKQYADLEEAQASLKEGQTYVDRLSTRKTKIDQFAQDLRNPSPASIKVREAQAFDETPDPVQAIAAYEEAVKLDPARGGVKTRLDELKKVWNIKAADLSKGRAFIFDTWPSMDPDDLDKRQSEMDDAVKAIEKHGDFVTALKLFKLNMMQREKLNAARNSLNPDTSEDDQEKAAHIDKIVKMIGEYNKRALEVLERPR